MDVRSRQSVTATQQTVGLPQVKAFGSWRVYLGAGVATGPSQSNGRKRRMNGQAINNGRKMLADAVAGRLPRAAWVLGDGSVRDASEGCGLLEEIVREESATPSNTEGQ